MYYGNYSKHSTLAEFSLTAASSVIIIANQFIDVSWRAYSKNKSDAESDYW